MKAVCWEGTAISRPRKVYTKSINTTWNLGHPFFTQHKPQVLIKQGGLYHKRILSFLLSSFLFFLFSYPLSLSLFLFFLFSSSIMKAS